MREELISAINFEKRNSAPAIGCSAHCKVFWISIARGEAKYFPSANKRASAFFKSVRDSKRFPLIFAFCISSNVLGAAQKTSNCRLPSRFFEALRHFRISSFDKVSPYTHD